MVTTNWSIGKPCKLQKSDFYQTYTHLTNLTDEYFIRSTCKGFKPSFMNSPEVPFVLLTQRPWVRITALPRFFLIFTAWFVDS